MMDVLYQCEDVRDHLNELAEMKTRDHLNELAEMKTRACFYQKSQL